MSVKSETDQYEYECEACFVDTHYSNLFEGPNGKRLCPDCFDSIA